MGGGEIDFKNSMGRGHFTMTDLAQKIESLLQDPDFREISNQRSSFNIFEAVGSVRSELKHSNFLAHILAPSRPHGLGQLALKTFLRAILASFPNAEHSLLSLELDVDDIGDAVVYRERLHIDLIIEIPSKKVVFAIENKVGSKVGDGQLERYESILARVYPQYRRIFVLLTPEDVTPDHEQYIGFRYSQVITALQQVVADPVEPVPTATLLIINHYVDLLKRYVVTDERLSELALKVFGRHREALDFIAECRLKANGVLSVIEQHIENAPDLVRDKGKSIVRFLPEEWCQLASLACTGGKWTGTGRGLLFEIKTYKGKRGRVNLSLVLGPCEPDARHAIFNMATENREIFVGCSKSIGAQYATLFSRELMTAELAVTLPEAEQLRTALKALDDFLENDLTAISDAIAALDSKLAGAIEAD